MQKLWSIPLIGIYLYGITSLTQYGYNSFFNIPGSYVETSLRANIIYFFQLFKAAEMVAGLMRWWVWAMVIFILAIFILLYLLDSTLSKIIISLITLILLIFLVNSFNFGYSLAANTQTFLGLSPDCATSTPNTISIVPVIYDNQGIIISIDKITKKIAPGFQVKDVAGISCTLESINTGKIIN
jgi:hypothetical protein